MKKVFLIFLVLACGLCFSQNYEPIRYTGKIPESILFDPLSVSKDLIGKEKKLKPEDATRFYSYIYFEKKKLLTGPYIYYNDPISEYVHSVAKNLFANEPAILDKIQVYVTRYPSPNAYSLPDGSIFINVGLISLLENEAQLAFIIAHEYAHIAEKHSLDEILKMNSIKDKEKNTLNPEGDVFRQLRFSRENEFESDAKALQYMAGSPYNSKESVNALKLLQDSMFLKFDNKIDFTYILPEELMKDSSLFKKVSAKRKKNDNFIFKQREYDDLFETHPALGSRITALEQILDLSEYKTEGKIKNNIEADKINKIKNICLYEMVENLFRDSDYFTSLYLSLKLAIDNPDQEFFYSLVLKNLYWLSYYKEIKSYEGVVSFQSYLQQKDYSKLYCLLNNAGLRDLRTMAYSFGKKHIEKLNKNDEFYYYYALSSEMFLGKEAAGILYKKYSLIFPQGRFINAVNSKLK